jgi:aspartate racemase
MEKHTHFAPHDRSEPFHEVLGVIGGMGPLATVNFFKHLVTRCSSNMDQGHPRILIDCNPRIPDRTDAILHQGASPVPEIVSTGQNLEKAGATFLAMPCVTAHCYYDSIQASLDTPLLSMIRETGRYLDSRHPGAHVGLLTTSGTLETGIFPKSMPHVPFVIPDESTQKEIVMGAIYGPEGVKSGHVGPARRLIRMAAMEMVDKGAAVLVAGCTEVSVILGPESADVPVVDPVVILADACLRRMGYGPKSSERT